MRNLVDNRKSICYNKYMEQQEQIPSHHRFCSTCRYFVYHYAKEVENQYQKLACGHCGRVKTLMLKRLFTRGCEHYSRGGH